MHMLLSEESGLLESCARLAKTYQRKYTRKFAKILGVDDFKLDEINFDVLRFWAKKTPGYYPDDPLVNALSI